MKPDLSSQTASVAKPRVPKFYKAQTYTPAESVGYLMRRIVSQLAAQIERKLEPSGLTNAQWVPLFMMSIGSANTGAELSRDCELDAGAMTRLLDRIEEKGLCRRERSSEDRRVVHLELTDEGRQAVKVVPQVLSKLQNQMLAGFTQQEWQQLQNFLRRMLENTKPPQEAGEITNE